MFIESAHRLWYTFLMSMKERRSLSFVFFWFLFIHAHGFCVLYYMYVISTCTCIYLCDFDLSISISEIKGSSPQGSFCHKCFRPTTLPFKLSKCMVKESFLNIVSRDAKKTETLLVTFSAMYMYFPSIPASLWYMYVTQEDVEVHCIGRLQLVPILAWYSTVFVAFYCISMYFHSIVRIVIVVILVVFFS